MKWYCLVLFGISMIDNAVEPLSRGLFRAMRGPSKSLIESARAPEENRWLSDTERCEEILIKGGLQVCGQDPKAADIAVTSSTLGLKVRRECDLWRVQQDSGGPLWVGWGQWKTNSSPALSVQGSQCNPRTVWDCREPIGCCHTGPGHGGEEWEPAQDRQTGLSPVRVPCLSWIGGLSSRFVGGSHVHVFL